MQTAAIYARVSTDWQAEHGYSLETQIAACEKYAHDLGAASVTKYIDDGYSGAYLDRPRLDALRDALRAKIYDVVIVYTPDRLSRRLSHQLLLTEEIERSGAALHFVSAEYKTTPEGQLFFQMQGAFAEYEREKIRERTMRGKRGKLKRGLPVSDAGVYGYDFKDGAYIINYREAETVRLIFRMYVEREGGTDAIAAKLAEMGIPSPRGLSKWQGGNVCRLLKKRMYTGEYYSNTHFSHKTGAHSRTVTPRPESEWISMSCPAIIDKATFEAAQHLLASNKKQAKRKYQRGVYLLQGLAVCAKCGRAIVIANNGEKRYYACISSGHPQPGQERCGARYAKTSAVDAAFWETLSKICATPAKIEAYIKKRTGQKPCP